jgi:thiol-disulfide isomerase/thioredoxin
MRLLTLFFFLSSVCYGQGAQSKLLQTTIHEIRLPDKNGDTINIRSLQTKKILIVELWATWCGPCITEMKKIPGLKKKFPDVEFYSISVDPSPEKMKKFITKNRYDWPIVYAGNDEFIWEYFSIHMIPKYYFVDATGTIVKVTESLDEKVIQEFL